jgi:hypothetical protein
VIAEQGGAGAKALVDEDGTGPKPGQSWRNPDLANTYKRIAEHGAAKGEGLREASRLSAQQGMVRHRAVQCSLHCNVDGVCPMSLVWLELLQLMKGRSGVALTQ